MFVSLLKERIDERSDIRFTPTFNYFNHTGYSFFFEFHLKTMLFKLFPNINISALFSQQTTGKVTLGTL